MSDSHFEVEVSEQSWFSRIGNAIKGLVFGLILFVVSFPFLFWNEGRAVKTARSLKEASGAVVSVSAKKSEPANNGKLIHLSGKATGGAEIKDPVFGLRLKALYARRVVEMYQWEQTKSEKTEKKLGGGTRTVTTYQYNKRWKEGRIASEKFKNPTKYNNPYPTYSKWSARPPQVQLGGFVLSKPLVSKLTEVRPLPMTPERKKQISPALLKSLKFQGDFLVKGNSTTPAIGDLRVRWFWLPESRVSVVAKQTNKRLVPYTTSNGRTVGLVRVGEFGPQQMIKQAQAENVTITWVIRFIGVFMMFLGLFLLFNPLAVLADVVPLFGYVADMGVFLFSMFLSLSLSSLTIAVAWVSFRPMVGVPLLVAAVVFFGLLLQSGRRRREEAEAPYAQAHEEDMD